MKGADLAAVQKIMGHQDPRITTEVYGHLQTTYLKTQIERLSFGPEPADRSGGGRPSREAGEHVAPGTAPRARTTPTTADLVSYWGGRHRLLRVREVAEQLGVSNATVYGLCERGELPYVWVVTSMRIRPDDLEAFIAARITVPVKRRPHRRKATE